MFYSARMDSNNINSHSLLSLSQQFRLPGFNLHLVAVHLMNLQVGGELGGGGRRVLTTGIGSLLAVSRTAFSFPFLFHRPQVHGVEGTIQLTLLTFNNLVALDSHSLFLYGQIHESAVWPWSVDRRSGESVLARPSWTLFVFTIAVAHPTGKSASSNMSNWPEKRETIVDVDCWLNGWTGKCGCNLEHCSIDQDDRNKSKMSNMFHVALEQRKRDTSKSDGHHWFQSILSCAICFLMLPQTFGATVAPSSRFQLRLWFRILASSELFGTQNRVDAIE